MNEDTKIKCTYCGALVDKTEEVCPQCSAPLKPAMPAKPAKQQAKTLAPTAIASLVLGILSISFSLLVIPGFILSSIGKSKAQEGFSTISANPNLYTGEGMLKAGLSTSKIGFILSFVGIAYWIFYGIYIVVLLNL